MDQVALTMASTSATSAASARSMDMKSSCKISMLWNWNTIDSCFIAESWRITSHAMFAGSCIGVILLVICLEFMRRLSKEYDRHILRCFKENNIKVTQQQQKDAVPNVLNDDSCCSNMGTRSAHDGQQHQQNKSNITTTIILSGIPAATAAGVPTAATIYFRPSLVQQSIRALLHMVTFAVAYFVMLLAMYYNGYFIISILIGAYVGAFVFTWERISVSPGFTSATTTSTEDVTVCCG